VDIIGGLHVPSIVVAHTVLKDPTPHQRSVFEAVAALAAAGGVTIDYPAPFASIKS
jgi:dihydroorotase-like cyclic amidohydrolase